MKLINHYRDWFVPHEGNHHHPKIIRTSTLALFVVFVLIIQLSFNFVTTGRAFLLGFATDINAVNLIKLTNQERISQGLSPLTINQRLNQAAQAKATDMFVKNYWGHFAPDGTSPWSFFIHTGYKYKYAGENLAKDFNTSNGVMSGWMASSAHKANILDTNYTDIGVAVLDGKLLGKDTTLVVALYGEPLNAVTANNNTSLAQAVQINDQVNGAQSTNLALKESAPSQVVYSFLNPLSLLRTLNWAVILTLLLLTILVYAYLTDHFIVHIRQVRRIPRSHSLLQASMLAVIILAIIATSFGRVG